MSVNIYDKVTGELTQIAGNANGVIDDSNVSNKTTYSSDKIVKEIDNKTNILDYSELVVGETKKIESTVNEALIRQEYLGGYIEIQPDSWDGEVCSTDSNTKTWGFPISLKPAERIRVRELMLPGNGKGIMYIRFPLGFAYRGYRNEDSTSHLAKNIGERFKGQNDSLKTFFEKISVAGGGLAPEYWCPAPYWVTSGSYSGTNELWAGGSNARTVTLASIKTSDSVQYNAQIEAFTNAIVDDLEYLHKNIAPVRMFSLQNEPSHGKENYGACKYDKTTYNDVMIALVPKIKASTILKTYNNENNEVKILIASSDELMPLINGAKTTIASTYITNKADYGEVWGFTHHNMRKASGETKVGDIIGADWYKTNDFDTMLLNQKSRFRNVFVNEYEYFTDEFTDEFRCSNNMLRMINEFAYSGAKVIHPVIHLLKPIAQTLSSNNTRGYCLLKANLDGDFGHSVLSPSNTEALEKGTCSPNPSMYNSWQLFADNLPINAKVVGDYSSSKSVMGVGYVVFKSNGKLYLFMANNSNENAKVTLTFNSEKIFDGKHYDLNICGKKVKSKQGTTIEFTIPAYSGQFWKENDNSNITEFLFEEVTITDGGLNSSTGAEENSNKKVRTDYIPVDKNKIFIKSNITNENTSHVARFYGSSKNFLGSSSNTLTENAHEFTHSLPDGTQFIRIILMKDHTANTIVSTDYFDKNVIYVDGKNYILNNTQ